MNKILLAGAAIAAVAAATGASAADLPSRKAPPPPPPVTYLPPPFTWTGFYVGVNGGYTWNDNKADYTYYGTTLSDLPAFPTGFLATNSSSKQNGFTGGGQAGYNYQFGQFVIGVEGDINYVGGKNSNRYSAIDTTSDLAPQSFTAYHTGGVDWLGTLRARAGFAVNNFLIYGTGGLAFGGTKSSTSFAYYPTAEFTGTPATWYGSKSDTSIGWTVGAGTEYAFTNNWTAKVEYLYYKLGDTSYALTDTSGTGFTANVKQQNSGNLVRAGLNYKF
jgi:outer membrane immunogenic protein